LQLLVRLQYHKVNSVKDHNVVLRRLIFIAETSVLLCTCW